MYSLLVFVNQTMSSPGKVDQIISNAVKRAN